MLKTEKATRRNVMKALEAATELQKGDIFVFYYSGHGGQQPDQTGPGKDELDGQDETLVLYDGELRDDSLNDVWMRLKPGVRVVMMSDSCNSGTNYKAPGVNLTQPPPVAPLDAQAAVAMKAQLIHMGGRRDSKTSAGHASGGLFTMALCNVWKGGAFTGTYKSLYDAVHKVVTSEQPDQQPAYNEYGPVSAEFSSQRPFELHFGNRVDTSGGAYVGGAVTIGSGDVVGRDKVVHGDEIHGDKLGGDKTSIGDLAGEGIAVGEGSRATVSRGVDAKYVRIDTLTINQGTALPAGANVEEKARKGPLIEDAIRLDVAAPRSAQLGEPFDIAVAVRQTDAPKLTVEDLDAVASEEGRVFREREDEVVKYRIEVVASGCNVVPSHYVLSLRPRENARPCFFQITSHRSGRRSIVVNAFQEDENLAAATRLHVDVRIPVQSSSRRQVDGGRG